MSLIQEGVIQKLKNLELKLLMLELKELIYLKQTVKQSTEECKLKEREKLKNLEQEVLKWR